MNNHIILNDTWFTDTISAISSSVTMLLCSCHEVQRSTASKSGEKSKSSFTEIYPNTIHVSMRIKETMNHEDKFSHYLLAHSTVLDTWPIGDRKSLRHEFRPARNTDLRGSASGSHSALSLVQSRGRQNEERPRSFLVLSDRSRDWQSDLAAADSACLCTLPGTSNEEARGSAEGVKQIFTPNPDPPQRS